MSAIVLLSGGLDSAVCLAQAVTKHERILAITFDYGQKAKEQELWAASQLTDYYQVKHQKIKLDFLQQITKTALVNQELEPPEPRPQDLDDITGVALETAIKVWVPNRNGLFINIAACFADADGFDCIITGFNREEAATFPDNTPEFLARSSSALELSTFQKPTVISYTQDLDKVGIVKLGLELKLPFQYIWSCYHGEQAMCGRCESCQRLQRALAANGITNLTQLERDCTNAKNVLGRATTEI